MRALIRRLWAAIRAELADLAQLAEARRGYNGLNTEADADAFTQEIGAARLVDEWRCSHCDADACCRCPGCSCSCRAPRRRRLSLVATIPASRNEGAEAIYRLAGAVGFGDLAVERLHPHLAVVPLRRAGAR